MHVALYARYKLGEVLTLKDLRLEVKYEDFDHKI